MTVHYWRQLSGAVEIDLKPKYSIRSETIFVKEFLFASSNSFSEIKGEEVFREVVGAAKNYFRYLSTLALCVLPPCN